MEQQAVPFVDVADHRGDRAGNQPVLFFLLVQVRLGRAPLLALAIDHGPGEQRQADRHQCAPRSERGQLPGARREALVALRGQVALLAPYLVHQLFGLPGVADIGVARNEGQGRGCALLLAQPDGLVAQAHHVLCCSVQGRHALLLAGVAGDEFRQVDDFDLAARLCIVQLLQVLLRAADEVTQRGAFGRFRGTDQLLELGDDALPLRFGVGLFHPLRYGQLIGATNRRQHGDGCGEYQIDADFERELHLRQSILLFGGSVKFWR